MSHPPVTGRVLSAVAVLEVTWHCNHACRFCSCPWFAGMMDQGPEMSISMWKQVIRQLAKAGVTQFAFSGGEAILKKELPDLLRFAAGLAEEKGGSLSLLSNGRALNDSWLDLLAQLGVRLGVSLPGLRSYPYLTDSDTGPEKILALFGRARERGIPTHAGITVTSANLGELYETMAEALLAGASGILLNRFLLGGRGLASPDLALSPLQTAKMLRTAETVLSRAKRKGNVGTEVPACLRRLPADALVRRRLSSRPRHRGTQRNTVAITHCFPSLHGGIFNRYTLLMGLAKSARSSGGTSSPNEPFWFGAARQIKTPPRNWPRIIGPTKTGHQSGRGRPPPGGGGRVSAGRGYRSSDSTAVMDVMWTMSSTVAWFWTTFTGFLMPRRRGPMASAFARYWVIL